MIPSRRSAGNDRSGLKRPRKHPPPAAKSRGSREAGLGDAFEAATVPDDEEVLDLLINKAVSMNNFSWPDSVLTRDAFAGSDAVVSAISKTGLDVNERYQGISHTPLMSPLSGVSNRRQNS